MSALERRDRVHYVGPSRNLKGHIGELGWRDWNDTWTIYWEAPYPVTAATGRTLRRSNRIKASSLRIFRNGNTSHDHWRPT